jgi:hypothetical protein
LLVSLVLLAVSSAAGGEKGAPSLKPVERQSKWGYADLAGKMVIAPQFDSAHSFSEGLAPLAVASRVAVIDKTGKVVIQLHSTKVNPRGD